MTIADEFEGIKKAALARTPALDPDTADFEARWVLAEFMADTRVWQRDVSLTILPGNSTYTIPLAAEESVAFLLAARYDGSFLPLGLPMPDATQTGGPRCAGMDDDRTVRVFPVPDASVTGKEFTVRVALTVTPTVETITMPTVLRPYHGVILDGLIARLYSMPDKPWTNTRLADPHLRRFQAGKTFARRDADSSRTYGSLTAKIPRFGV